jgi:hypothetical protein
MTLAATVAVLPPAAEARDVGRAGERVRLTRQTAGARAVVQLDRVEVKRRRVFTDAGFAASTDVSDVNRFRR